MTRIMISAFAMAILSAAPLAAKPVGDMSSPELLRWAAQRNPCGGAPLLDASYLGRNRVQVVCGTGTGVVPKVAGTLARAGGPVVVTAGALALGAVAVGLANGNNNTNNTQ